MVKAMKRKLKWLAIVLAISLLGFGTALLLWPRDRITADSWKQIRLGMTVKEVENMLGEPGSRHVDIWRDLAKEPGNWFAEPNPFIFDGTRNLTWIGRNGFIDIRYDERRQVIGKYFGEFPSTRPSFIDRLRDWLGW
jgi:hypothetical protein